MGEVYRARDSRLGRDVALKVLPDAVAHDPDRLARFQREAQLLAALNHPNIAAVYGLEEANGITAILLELVEGETLAERIARGPLPLDEALDLGRQIADALAAAHENGGRQAFSSGDTVSDTIAAILTAEPARSEAFTPHSPSLGDDRGRFAGGRISAGRTAVAHAGAGRSNPSSSR